jgi:hypothetical protein
LLLEILPTRLRRHVNGLTLDIGTLLAVGYADNLTIFVESDTELQKALCIIENFKTGSGLAVNREKSEILELGIKSTTLGIPVKQTIKITGMHFCLDQVAMSQKNWYGLVNRIKTLTRSWKQQSLTEVGRANIIKAQLLPIISFVGSTLNLPPSYEKQLKAQQSTNSYGQEERRKSKGHSVSKQEAKVDCQSPISNPDSQRLNARGFNACKNQW